MNGVIILPFMCHVTSVIQKKQKNLLFMQRYYSELQASIQMPWGKRKNWLTSGETAIRKTVQHQQHTQQQELIQMHRPHLDGIQKGEYNLSCYNKFFKFLNV